MERILWRAFERLELRFRDGGFYRFDVSVFDEKAKALTEQLVSHLLKIEQDIADAEEWEARAEIEAEASAYTDKEDWHGGAENEPEAGY